MADVKSVLGAQHINSMLNEYEAARSGFFSFLVPGVRLNGMMSHVAGKDDENPERISEQAADYLELNVVKAPVPHFTVEDLKYRRGNEEVHFAGVPSFKSGSITVDDVVGLRTKDILMAWQAKTYDVHTGKGGRMRDYKIDCKLIEYTQDYVPIRTWTLVGCFPTGISEEDFNKEGDGKRQLTMEIVYDRAWIEPDGATPDNEFSKAYKYSMHETDPVKLK